MRALRLMRASKARLFEMQTAKQFAVVDYRAEAHENVLDDAEEPLIQFIDDIEISEQHDWPSLQGPHNRQNAAAAVAVCGDLGLERQVIEAALRTYPGLPHRMERVAEVSDVAYINDSKGTNTAASAPALAAFDKIHWIVGGQAKEPGLGECEANLGHVKAAYTIGQAGPAFADLLKGRVPVTRSGTLDRAVGQASRCSEPGDTVLLSPACASFDQFRDFEERGEVFRSLVAAVASGRHPA